MSEEAIAVYVKLTDKLHTDDEKYLNSTFATPLPCERT
jgi:hypothetical protein